VVSDTLAGLSTADGRISGGSGASPVVADFDKNGAPELLVGSSDGTFLYFTKSGSVWVPASGPTTAAGGGLAVSGGIGCVRVADWNGDNRVDIIVSDLSNHILVFRNMSSTGGLVFETGSIIYTAGAGTLTGFDIADLNGDAKPDFVLGFVDGTVTTVSASGSFTWEDPAWDASSVVLVEGVPLNAGSGAMPCVTELTGDTGLDLLVANGAGQVMFYKNRNDGSFQDRGVMNAAGKPLEGNTIAVVFGEQGEFVSFIVSDASGKLSAGQGLLRGDFHADSDNEVNVMDLQVFGDAWGKIETDDGWVWKCNLDQTPDGSGKQVIDVFDLAIFGDSWLAKK